MPGASGAGLAVRWDESLPNANMAPENTEKFSKNRVLTMKAGIFAIAVSLLLSWIAPAGAVGPNLSYPVMFVTQVPIRPDFTTIGSTFGNHRASLRSVGRGGDLYIRYGDGSLKNLTQAAGYGSSGAGGFQDANAIAVRDPAIHWDGNKALFSMVIGAPETQYVYNDYFWQLYEVTGLGPSDTPVISKVPNQPPNYNNVNPTYGADDAIIFVSDRPRNGAAHLYPQRDEYESAPSNSGVWKLFPGNGELILLNHAPSGDFTPIVDSFGRVIFTQWDHLQRDQQADGDSANEPGAPASNTCGPTNNRTFNYSNESASAMVLNERSEVFPEPRRCRGDLLAGTNLYGHTINHFIPWMMNADGTEIETLNHVGRHELHNYLGGSRTDDPNVVEYYRQYPRTNTNSILNMFHVKEDPLNPGRYFGTDAPEFRTHASGQIVRLDAAPSTGADAVSVTYVTHRDTNGNTATVDHSGHYREPVPLSDGTLIAAHTSQTANEADSGASIYQFRLTSLALGGNGYYAADQVLTPGINKTISYWDPDRLVTYSGVMWELNPVEVRSRTRPPVTGNSVQSPEQQIFDQAAVSVPNFKQFLRDAGLALIVSRNVTSRDDLDKQQPFNLRIAGGGAQTIGASGTVYDVSHLQLFQGDQLRGMKNSLGNPREGRRVIAQVMHENTALANNGDSGGPAASVALSSDGSLAAFVPTRRALTWQLTVPNGEGVVRERNWLTFQPGEIRVCASCHGVNENNQAGNPPPTNPPEALFKLLKDWKMRNGLAGDLNADSLVDSVDLGILMSGWGSADRTADIDGDGVVGNNDLRLYSQSR